MYKTNVMSHAFKMQYTSIFVLRMKNKIKKLYIYSCFLFKIEVKHIFFKRADFGFKIYYLNNLTRK